MAYLLQLVAREVPVNDAEVFPFLEEIAGHTVSMAPSQQLKSFREAILKLFPCLSSYGPADAAKAQCPWADGPFGDNFKGGFGSVAIARRHDEVIPHLLRIASDLGMTVVDEQRRTVHRPQTFQVVLEGPLDGVQVDVAAPKLAELMNQPMPHMILLLHSRRRTMVKRGLTRTQGEIYIEALRQRASCKASLVPDPRKPDAVPVPPAANAKAPVRPAQPFANPVAPTAHAGIEADDELFTAAEAQRSALVAALGGAALSALVALDYQSLYVFAALAAMGLLGMIAVFQLGQAQGGGLLRTLRAPLALVPGLGILLLLWTYFSAAGILKNKGVSTGSGMPAAAVVRELGGLPHGAMLPSIKKLLGLLVLAAVVAAVFMPKGH